MTIRRNFRIFLMMVVFAAFAAPLLCDAPARAMNHMGNKQGKKNGMTGKMGGKKSGNSLSGKAGFGKIPTYNRAEMIRRGLIPTGVTAQYPKDAACLEVKSPFASTSRFDGSDRNANANHGYHEGFDISSDEGTPLVALADGEVVHVFAGKRLVGNQIYLRHTPEDTGLPVWVYSKYKHFRELPDFKVGDRVKMGQVLGPSGKTGTTGGHFGYKGYPHLHLSVYVSKIGDYQELPMRVSIAGEQILDPMALYLLNDVMVYDNHALATLPAERKVAKIPYMTKDGKAFPAGTRLIWPYLCEAK